MTGRLSGRTIVITGSASGIGASIARACAVEEAQVVVADLDVGGGESVAADIRAAGGRCISVRVDVADRRSVQAAIATTVQEFGHLDVLFNNAGMNVPMRFLDVTEENFSTVMKVNALGVLIGTQEAAKQFLAQGTPGKIINTASIAGRTGFADFAPYSASKAAVISLTQAAARSLAGDQITVNAFAPGVVATPLWTKLDADLDAMGAGESGFDSMASQILLGRPAQPEDIAPTAVFLAASDSDYITGQVIPIEGGMILV